MKTSIESEAIGAILGCLPGECTVVDGSNTSPQALAAWYRGMKRDYPDRTPLIIQLDEVLAEQLKYVARESDTQERIARANTLYAGRYGGESQSDVCMEADERMFKEVAMMANMNGASLGLVLLPTTNAWEALCYVPMGGFNDCPPSEELAAQFRHWQNAYCVQPFALTYDSVFLLRGPTEGTDMRAFADELFELCGCYMDAFPTADDLAAALAEGESINLWWD